MCSKALCSLSAVIFLFVSLAVYAQRPAGSNAYYQQLRSAMPSGDAITVHNLELRRDAATFTFRDGNIAFFAPVNGKVTGAVFRGDGHLHITPPTPQERHNLSIVAHSEELDEDFDQVVMRFTDGTETALNKAATGKAAPDASFAKAAQSVQDFTRRQLHQNIELRLLQDVLSPAPGGFFLADVHSRKDAHLFFFLDPNGISGLAPEEVALLSINRAEGMITYPLAFHRSAEYAAGTPRSDEDNGTCTITSEDLDVSIEKNGYLSSVATVEVRADQDGVAVVPMDLYSTLRVSSIRSSKGDDLEFVQERKEDDPDFGVLLAAPLKKGETASLKITYSGKDVVLNMGQGNYYPVARENWFPNDMRGFGNYATYTMTFHVPKGLQVIATGEKLRDESDGRITTTAWKTGALPVVGFSIGDFSIKEAKIGSSPTEQLVVDAYANNGRPDQVQQLANDSESTPPLGSLQTTPMLAEELSQGTAAVKIYTSAFGPLPFSHIALTQQSACNYGQSWPMLVFLPICGFFDSTQQHFLGVGGENSSKHMYWQIVTPHEVAHQWWGSAVGFGSYRDEWMSEGFADASAALYLQSTRNKPDDFLRFWKEERTTLTQKNSYGFRPIDVGPVTMGIRLISPKAGWSVYGDLVYPKGAFILHMMRMMMWSPKDGDARFFAAMHDFVSSHRLKTATTEDFKAAMEKYMTQTMDVDGNHRLDWFFNEYVYGTELPAYHFDSQLTPSANGASLHVTLVQSGVSSSFKMVVPIYLEFTDGRVTRLAEIAIVGDSSFDHTFELPKLPNPVKKASINYYYDVLSVDN